MNKEKYVYYINEYLNKMSDTALKKIFDYINYCCLYDDKECVSHE